MLRRIYGLENEYGITFAGQRRLSPDEVARYLFRQVVHWGRSSNVFLKNGARLYLDVGSHPEYATPECDSIYELVVHDRAGEEIMRQLATYAQERLNLDGNRGEIYVFKNNTDTAGNSYGCHENYLVSRKEELNKYTEALIPFLVSRQIYSGAGKIQQTPRGPQYRISQRAEHIWEGVSSATTRSRPIINTRDEPHADAERYRRLHVIVGDSNMSEYATYLKVGACSIVLRMLEEPSVVLRDMTLDNPIRAIREISEDLTCRHEVRMANARMLSALDIQREYYDRALEFAEKFPLNTGERQALKMWGHCLTQIEKDPLGLDRECDWVIKHNLLDAFGSRYGIPLNHPKMACLDLLYHDMYDIQASSSDASQVNKSRGLFHQFTRRGVVEKICLEDDVKHAVENPPQTTRARLRGEFVRRAQESKRDFTVDWVHLKLNDQAQQTILCDDPFKSHDDRVEKLIAAL